MDGRRECENRCCLSQGSKATKQHRTEVTDEPVFSAAHERGKATQEKVKTGTQEKHKNESLRI